MKKLTALLIAISFLLGGEIFAQTIVKGTVSDDGGTIPGVNVREVGTTNGTITNIDGGFSLKVAGSESVLEFSYLGYTTKTATVGNQSTIDIVLDQSDERLEEVVVTALGFTVKKDESAQVSSSVKGGAISNSGEATFLNALGAKASNVQISRSNGDPGAGTTIRIRGANTISGSSNPLIILDGIPINNSTVYAGGNELTDASGDGGTSQQSRLNDINPNDIESVEILKGAAAAALWGSRAANGVIVITTKNGKLGKLTINFKSTYSIDQVNKRYPMQNVWGQGRDGVFGATRSESWGDYIPDRPGGADEVDMMGEYFVADDGTIHYPIITKNSKETFVDSNWDEVFQTGGYWQNDLSISGGSERTQYFFSISDINQKGIIKNSNYDRNNVRINVRFYPNKWFNASTKASYVHSNSNRIQQSSNTSGLLLGLLRNPADFDISDYKGTYYRGDGTPGTPFSHRAYRRQLGSNYPAYSNPAWTAWEQVSSTDVDRFIISQEVNITLAEALKITARGGIDRSADNRIYFFPIFSSDSPVRSGAYAEDAIGIQEANFDIMATGNLNLTEKILLTATVGWNYNDRKYKRNTGQITGFLVNSRKETTDLNTAATNSQFDINRSHRASNRGYYSLNFKLFDQVFFNTSGGLEAASSVKGSFFYPAFDLAWQFSDNISSDIFSFGKLRASWGMVGVQPSPHRFEETVEGDFQYTSYDSDLDINLWGGGFRLNDDLNNMDLKPEIKTEWEIGADLRFFKDKLSLSATYYQNEIKDMLIPVGLSPSFGYDTQYANAATMENKGFELEMNYDIIKKEDFSVNTYVIWGTNKNEVTDLAGTESISLAAGSVDSRAVEGQPLGVMFGTGAQTNADGSFILDANGFPQTTSSPIVLGDPNPDWTGSFGVNAKWKNLGFNILFSHSQGGDFCPRTLWVLRRFGTTEETANRITLTQDMVNSDGDIIPSGTTVRGNIGNFGGGGVLLDETWYRHGIGGGLGDNQLYNFAVYDATWTRLKELSLSYTINSAGFRDKTKLSSVVFTASGRNLVIWDGIPGVDPEINQTGVNNGFGLDYFTNPSTRSFLFSISITY